MSAVSHLSNQLYLLPRRSALYLLLHLLLYLHFTSFTYYLDAQRFTYYFTYYCTDYLNGQRWQTAARSWRSARMYSGFCVTAVAHP